MGYMSPDTESLYDKIDEEKTSESVFELWCNIARQYFNVNSGFTPGLVGRKSPELFVIEIYNDRMKAHLFLAVPKNFDEYPDSHSWKHAIEGTATYMIDVRHRHLGLSTQYAIVAMGGSVRFLTLEPGNDRFDKLPGTSQGIYDVKDNEEEIETILLELGVAASRVDRGVFSRHLEFDDMDDI